MNAQPLTLKIFLMTGAVVTLIYYAAASLNLGGFQSSNWKAADMIREQCPIHLVRPEWVKATEQGDMLFKWMTIELRARVAFLSGLWLLGVGLLVHQSRKNREVI